MADLPVAPIVAVTKPFVSSVEHTSVRSVLCFTTQSAPAITAQANQQMFRIMARYSDVNFVVEIITSGKMSNAA